MRNIDPTKAFSPKEAAGFAKAARNHAKKETYSAYIPSYESQSNTTTKE